FVPHGTGRSGASASLRTRPGRTVGPGSRTRGPRPRAHTSSPPDSHAPRFNSVHELCTTRCVALGVGARGAYTRGHSETRHGDVRLPEPAPRLRVPPSWRPRV